MEQSSLIAFAKVVKTFGANGQVVIRFRDNAPLEIDVEEPVYAIFDGLAVPFFFLSFEEKGNDKANVIFENMETLKLAEELVGKELYYPKEYLEKFSDQPEDESVEGFANSIMGFSFIDSTTKKKGKIVDFYNYPCNPLLVLNIQETTMGNNEILLPLHPEFITNVDWEKNVVYITSPQGLLTL